MKKLLAAVALTTLALSAGPAAAQGAAPVPEVKATGTPGVAEAVRTSKITATVTAVDVANRTVTLKGPKGNERTIQVDKRVERLDEVAVGDKVQIEFQEGLMLELQPSGAAPVEPEAVVIADKAGKDQAPGGVAAEGVRATVTVTAIDKANRMVVFQGPGGRFHQVKAGPKIDIEKLKVGDKLVATYVQAVAVQLQKAAKK